MFDSIEYIGSGSPKRMSFLISLVLHGSVIAAAINTPLLFLRSTPLPLAESPEKPVMLTPDFPVALSGGGSARKSTSRNPPVVRLPPNVVPPAIPSGIPDPVFEQTPEIGQLAINQDFGRASLGGSFGPGGGFGVVGDMVSPGRIASPPLRKIPEPSPAEARTPLRVSAGVIASKLVHRVDPVYSPLAIRARVQGLVVLQVLINEQGSVAEVSVMSGQTLLVPSAIEAVKQWRYSPTFLSGQPVPVRATVTVHFVLR